MTAVRFADALARQDGILKKLVTPLAAPIPELYFRPLKSRIPDGASVVLLMIADFALEAFRDFLEAWPGEILLERAAADPKRRALPVYELVVEPHHPARAEDRPDRHLSAGPLSAARAR